MPPPLLEAVASPFIYGNRDPPPHMAPGVTIARVNAQGFINSSSITPRSNIISVHISRGVARPPGVGWRMRSGLSGSRRALFADAAGLSPRTWAGVGPDRGGSCGGEAVRLQAMGSAEQYQNQEGEVGVDGGFKQQQKPSSRLLTLPTVLTIGRVAAVPLLVSTFYMNSWWATTATTSIFLAAAITDWLDGYLARKMRVGTAFGAFLDPVADKLMVAATLVLLCTRPLEVAIFGEVPWLLIVPSIAIIGREITMSAVREWAASQDSKVLEAVAVNNLGKWKTATQMTALTILLALRDSSLSGPGIIVASGVVLLYLSAGLAVWSLVVYMGRIWRMLLK